jgi:hypothetical protein
VSIEDKIAKIIKDAYAGTGFEDEGRSTEAAHDIMAHVSHGWQPIETAPKNQMIDLLFRGDQRIVDCIFYCGEWWSCEQGDPVVCVSSGLSPKRRQSWPSQPLYWMPIPEPPK